MAYNKCNGVAEDSDVQTMCILKAKIHNQYS